MKIINVIYWIKKCIIKKWEDSQIWRKKLALSNKDLPNVLPWYNKWI